MDNKSDAERFSDSTNDVCITHRVGAQLVVNMNCGDVEPCRVSQQEKSHGIGTTRDGKRNGCAPFREIASC
jgi:hypothetical protein